MQRFLFVALLGAAVVVSCKKGPGVTTRIALHNATFSIDSLTMQWNGAPAVSNYLAEGKTSGTPAEPYVTLIAGTNNIVLKSGNTVLVDKNAYGGANTSYTLLGYDSTASPSSLSFIFLTDVLSLPDTINAQFRFINCVNDVVDSVRLVNAVDTLNITSGFIGSTPDISTIQAFNGKPPGTYQPQVFKNGQGPIVYGNVVLQPQQFYSLIYSGRSGSAGADSLKMAMINHPVH